MAKRICIIWGAYLIFLLLPFFKIFQHTVFAAVVINEIFPKTADISEQWIELYNNGEESVSLDRWKIENTFGEQKSFSLNASVILSGKSFVTLHQSQYGFSLSKEGDTIRLLDGNNNQVDSQNYQGILGYNTSVGRSTDGAGAWVVCITATENKQNDCPAPTPTAIPPATLVPTAIPTPLPTETEIPTIVPTLIPTVLPLPTENVLAVTTESVQIPATTASNTNQLSSRRLILVAILGIIGVWAFIAVLIIWNKKRRALTI